MTYISGIMPGTRKADIDTIRDMVLRRHVEPERWERRFSIVEMDELDVDQIRVLVRSAEKTSRMQFHDRNNPCVILGDLALLKYGTRTPMLAMSFSGKIHFLLIRKFVCEPHVLLPIRRMIRIKI